MEVVEFAGVDLDAASLAQRLRVADRGIVEKLLSSAVEGIQCKAAFRSAYVDARSENGVVVDGVTFNSRVLRHNLDGVGRVFPFVLTAGKAFDELVDGHGDVLEKYLLDEIGNMALRDARRRFEQHVRSTFALEKISCMAPGSLEDWPIEQQRALFALLPGVESVIGVRLTDSLLMLPRKSISGIYFPSEVTFFSCQLCPRDRCDARKARYDAEKAKEYGVLK